MSNTDRTLYILDLRFPDNPPKRIEVIGKISIGSDESATLSIQGYSLSPTHCLFRVVNGVLSVHNLAPTGMTTIDGQDLVQGRMYILDKGDELEIADIQIIIRTQIQDTDNTKKLSEEDNISLESSLENNIEMKKPESNSRSFPVDLGQVEEEEDDEFDEVTSLSDSKFNIKHFITSLTSKLKLKKIKNKTQDSLGEDEEDSEHTSVSINKLIGGDATKGKIKPSTINTKVPLKGKKKAPDFSKNGLKKSQHALKVPGFFPRIISITLTFCLAYLLSSYIPEEQSKSLLAKVNLLTKDFLKAYLNISIISTLISYIIIDLVSHLTLGTTLPLFVMGVRENSSFVISRAKAVLRSLLGIITTPLVILDIPLIVRKRSFKEVATASHLQYKNSWMKYLIVIYAPIIIILTLTLPLFSNINYLTAPSMIERTIKISSRKKKGQTQYVIKATIEEMLINIHGMLPKYILLFPEIKKTKKRDQFSLKFINTKTGENLLLTQINSYEYKPFVDKAKTSNPSFKTLYPRLAKKITKDTKLKARKEFSRLVKYLFETDYSKLVPTIKNLGPFLEGPLEMKMMLMDTFRIKESDQLTYFHLKRNMITHPALYIRSHKISKLNHDKILLFMNDSIVELKLSYKKSSKRFAKKFPNLILKSITPMFVKLKKNNKIGTGLKNSFKLLSSLEKNCSQIKDIEFSSYEALVKANNIKLEGVDTKVKNLVEEVLQNSKAKTLRYVKQMKIDSCPQATKVKELISGQKIDAPETMQELEAGFPDQVQEMKSENDIKIQNNKSKNK